MSLNANALCGLEELKSFIGSDLTDTSKDSIYEIYINAVSKQIENIIGRFIFSKDYIERYKGTNSTELLLQHYPINEITSIKYVSDGQEYRILNDYEYEFESENGIVYKENGWLLEGYSSFMSRKIDYPRRHIKVTYNGGFTEPPADLKLICLRYISDNYGLDNSKGGTLKSYSISDVKLEYRDEIKFSQDDLSTIKSYKAVRF